MPQRKAAAAATNDASLVSPGCSLADIMTKLTALGLDLSVVKDSQGEVMASIEFLSGKFDEINKRLDHLQVSNDTLQKENDCLKHQVSRLQLNVKQLEQYNRGQSIEIAGIPETPLEDINTIIMSVIKKVDSSVCAEDIDIAHRAGPSTPTESTQPGPAKKPRSIVVRFTTRRTRNKIYEQRKSLKDVKLPDLGLGFRQPTSIFVNENLVPETKLLLFKANVARKNKGHRFLWTHNGKILVKKSPDTPAILITTDADLSKIQ